MGDSYLSDTRDGTWGFLRAGWTTMRQCQWVEPSAEAEGAGTSILFFRNRNGLGERPMKIRSG
jgi:omega-6 fatty acid desaturase (delta-12 desaturase)